MTPPNVTTSGTPLFDSSFMHCKNYALIVILLIHKDILALRFSLRAAGSAVIHPARSLRAGGPSAWVAGLTWTNLFLFFSCSQNTFLSSAILVYLLKLCA